MYGSYAGVMMEVRIRAMWVLTTVLIIHIALHIIMAHGTGNKLPQLLPYLQLTTILIYGQEKQGRKLIRFI